MAKAEIVLGEVGSSAPKIYRYNGARTGLSSNKITCTDETTGQTFKPKAIMVGSIYSGSTTLVFNWSENDPTNEQYMYGSTTATTALVHLSSIDDDGFTIALANFNNMTPIQILAIG